MTALEVHQKVASLLRHPLPRRVRRDPGQVHPPGAVLDEEQHVQTAQEHGIDVEEDNAGPRTASQTASVEKVILTQIIRSHTI
jgi:hypothetical protein